MNYKTVVRLATVGLALALALLPYSAACAETSVNLCGVSPDGLHQADIELRTDAAFNLLIGPLYGQMVYTGPSGPHTFVIYGAGHMSCVTDNVTLRGSSALTDAPASQMQVIEGHLKVKYEYVRGRHIISSAGSSFITRVHKINLGNGAVETSEVKLNVAPCNGSKRR